MPQMGFKNTLSIFLALFFLVSISGVSNAALNMDEIRYLFEKENSKQWEVASSAERRDFIRDVQGREEYKEEVEYKGKVERKSPVKKREIVEDSRMVEGVFLSEEKEEKAPYSVRKRFESEKGLKWKDASKKNQEAFWKKFVKKEEGREKREEAERKKIELDEKKVKKEREEKKKAIKAAKKEKESKRKKKEQENKQRRQKEKEKLKKAQSRLKEMRTKAKSR